MKNVFVLMLSFNVKSSLIIVDQADDLQNGPDGGCDLREAIQAADTDEAVNGCSAGDPNNGDIILFQVAGPIQLTDQLEVLAGMRITPPVGSGEQVEIRAAAHRRICHVRPPVDGDERNDLGASASDPVSALTPVSLQSSFTFVPYKSENGHGDHVIKPSAQPSDSTALNQPVRRVELITSSPVFKMNQMHLSGGKAGASDGGAVLIE
jgi:hypothetical protein